MIVALQGEIEKHEPMRVWLAVSGITYEILTSIHTSSAIKGEQTRLLITQIIREDSSLLYGFISETEKGVFDTLIKINGIGPKVAIAILSTYTPETFSQIVTAQDVKALQRVPGIGAKSAGRIMVELAGFSLGISPAHSQTPQNQIMHEALLALETLGFKSDSIEKVLKTISPTTTQEVIKQALQKLQTVR